ncbi:hypothetical protein [Sphingomonas sp. PR090111-T3T-6A]|uniref:hypothetical protein n=1 Tax=Sphingomonas sp. PR090111-T3T-6A TaxID=685778 RepID=UPI00037C89F2|nr:hypothetical protein [Sphingomonas sp. PR090111-T3T-6A]
MQTSLRQRMVERVAPPPRHRAGAAIPIYQIALQFDVRSTLQLWHAAAQRLRESGLSTPDIETTIGLASDPSIADCLATLILPRHAPGCDLIDVRIGQSSIDDLFASPLPNASEH